MNEKIRLETRDGKFVAYTTPVLPFELEIFAIWGERFFKLYQPNVYRECRVTVLQTIEGLAQGE